MKAIIIEHSGGPEVLKIKEIPTPTPYENQILVKVHATTLNRDDLLQRQGKNPVNSDEYEILGLEIAGEIQELGPNVRDFKKGDRVCGLVNGGGYAEYCVMDASLAMRIPKNYSYEEAAAIPETFLIANEALFQLGELKAGESVLIHAGGSGVATAAVQLARYMDAMVYVTAGSQEKIDKAMAYGVTEGINYKTEDFAMKIMQLTGDQGVNLIVDFMGASFLGRHLQILKRNGRLVMLATMGGKEAHVNVTPIISKQLQIKGTVLRDCSLEEKGEITERFVKRWLPALEAGHIKPIIDSVFPLEQARQAHMHMEARQHFGKIILKVD
jgi:putative PIG3 family NAD(P)H quinone oxidoreductase